jgi:hypothetical protein
MWMYCASFDKVERNCHFPASGRTATNRRADFIVFIEQYLTHTGKTLQRLAVCHAVPVGGREVTVAFNFISERSVFLFLE